jgi:hypothetical protein
MKRHLFMAMIAIAAFSVSCKEDKENLIEPEADFMHLQVGNYWVYEFYKIDTNGVETKLEETDSAYILKDSVYKGKSYFVKVQNPYEFNKSALSGGMGMDTVLLCDSSGYLVNQAGFIYFAQDNFDEILNTDSVPGLFWMVTRMTGKDSVVTVPEGSFITRTICSTYYPLNPQYEWGIRKAYTVYGKDAGPVKYNYGFYNSGINYEARLIRYK